MLAFLFLWLLVDVTIFLTYIYMPVIRGEDAFFGVRVSPEVYRGQGRQILNRYRFWLSVTFIEIEIIGLLVSIYRAQLPYGRIPSLLLLTAAGTILYMIFYRQVKAFEIVDEKQRFASSLKVRHLGDYTSIVLELVVTLLTVFPVLVLIYYYPELPERIPVHWNWRGEPDRWARKSFATVFFLPAMMIYLQGLFLLFKHGMLQTKMTLPAEQTEEYLKSKEKSLTTTIRMMDQIRGLIAVLMGTLSLNIIFSAIDRLRFLMTAVAVISTIAGILIFVCSIYYICRLVMIDSELKEKVGRVYVQRKTDAEHWYGGGLFYYNPDDPALFVEKMVGIGYTLNMGNKRVYIYLAYLTLLPLLIAWAVKAL